MKYHRARFAVPAFFVLSSSLSHGAVLAQWLPTAGDATVSEYSNTTQTPTPTIVIGNLDVSTLARVNQPVIGNNGSVWPGYIANNGGTAGVYDATSGGYTQFTMTPDTGYELGIGSITYQLNSYGGMNDAGGYTGVVRTSADSFASEVATFTITNAASGLFDFDLSGASLEGITEALTVRLYFVNNAGGGTWADLAAGGGGLTVNGTLESVPEPSALLLAGLSALGLFIRRR